MLYTLYIIIRMAIPNMNDDGRIWRRMYSMVTYMFTYLKSMQKHKLGLHVQSELCFRQSDPTFYYILGSYPWATDESDVVLFEL